MGTPDLLGTYGTFQLLTTDAAVAKRRISGGIVHELSRSGAEGQRVTGVIEGPTDPMDADLEVMTTDVEIVVDPRAAVALVRLGDEELILQPGEWSDWHPVFFDPGLLAGAVPGIVRVYLKSLSPHVTLYVSPINLDPAAPAMPISSPESYAEDIAHEAGRFYTQGMPEDTKALAGGVLDDDEFLAQADLVFEEEMALFERELARYQGGFLFYYFSVLDQVSHMFMRAIDDKSPAADQAYAAVIPGLYERVDRAVGLALDNMGPNTTLIVMSDHGFAHYDFKVNLNTWLLERGYLSLADTPGAGPMGHIDWKNTQAYAMGLNQLFVNLQGREPEGVVPLADREVLTGRLIRELEAMRDPRSGARVVTRVIRPEEGPFVDRAPDLLVGFAKSYRSSDESAMGQVQPDIVFDNHDKWSGDHCMDPHAVPGVFLSTAKVTRQTGSLVDLAPTILAYFGLEVPDVMEGTPLLSPAAAPRAIEPTTQGTP